MDEPEGLQAAAHGIEFGKPAAFLFDQVILDATGDFGRFKNIFPLCGAFSKQNRVTLCRFCGPVLEMERADCARFRANPANGILAGPQTRAPIPTDHDPISSVPVMPLAIAR